ncbi:MAG: VanW family protein [Microgenomates group bacterium]
MKKNYLNLLFSFLKGILLGIGLIFLFLTGVIFFLQKKYQDRVYPGIFLFSLPLEGKTPLEIKELLEEKEEEIKKRKLVFLFNNNGERKWEITPSMIDWSLNKELIINDCLTKGRGSFGFLELYRLIIFPLEIKPEFLWNKEELEKIINQIASEVNRPAQEALFEFKEGKVINFQVSKEGQELKKEEVEKLIILAFSQPLLEKNLLVVELPVRTLFPRITTEKSNQLGIKELLGEGESFFYDSIPSRIHNIALASSYLHGVVIPPGEIFSFAKQVGEITSAKGYQPAYVIKNKETVLEDGGGVCQVSTTLFRAALNAGLPIVERKAHYYRVGYYEQGGYPPGLDATVYPPSPDFKFKNDTPAYILIQAEFNKKEKQLVFKLYGTSDGRKVEISKPIIHSQTPPPEPVYLDDPNLPPGVIKKIDSPHWGAKVSFTRKVWNADGSLKEEQTFWSNYVAWPAVYKRGIGQ